MEAKTLKEMSLFEQRVFIAKLLHAMNHFDTAFCMAKEIITLSESRHVFDGTEFMPNDKKPSNI